MPTIKINSAVLRNALEKANKFLPKSAPILPEYSMFYFSVCGNDITIATNENGNGVFKTVLIGDCEGEGSFLAEPCILELLKRLKPQVISITVNDSYKITIIHAQGKMTMYGDSPKNFGEILEVPTADNVGVGTDDFSYLAEFILSAKTLCPALKKAVQFVSKDELRPAMTGVNFEVDSNSLKLCATDAHRLMLHTSIQETFLEVHTPSPEKDHTLKTNFIMPARLAAFLAAYKLENAIFFARTRNAVFIKLGLQDVVYFQSIDARYPDYTAVMPEITGNEIVINADKAALIETIQRVFIGADSAKTIRLKSSASSTAISAKNEDYKFYTSEFCTNSTHTGEGIRIGFNAVNLLELLKMIECQEVELLMRAANRAVIIKDSNSPEFYSMIMPVILGKEEEEEEEPAAPPVKQEESKEDKELKNYLYGENEKIERPANLKEVAKESKGKVILATMPKDDNPNPVQIIGNPNTSNCMVIRKAAPLPTYEEQPEQEAIKEAETEEEKEEKQAEEESRPKFDTAQFEQEDFDSEYNFD